VGVGVGVGVSVLRRICSYEKIFIQRCYKCRSNESVASVIIFNYILDVLHSKCWYRCRLMIASLFVNFKACCWH